MGRLPRNHGLVPCRIDVKDHQARDEGGICFHLCGQQLWPTGGDWWASGPCLPKMNPNAQFRGGKGCHELVHTWQPKRATPEP